MRRIAAYLRATHLAPSMLVTALTLLLAVAVGHGPRAVLIAGAVLSGQFCIGWVNDVIDADRDAAAGRANKPIAAGEIRRRHVGAAAASSGGLCVVLSLLLGPDAAAAHLTGVGAGLAYDVWLKGTVASPLPYAVAFALVPGALVLLALEPSVAPPAWLLAAGALMGVGAHFLNALPDLVDDVAHGVRGLPQHIGPVATLAVGSAGLASGAIVAALGAPDLPPSVRTAVPAFALLALAVAAGAAKAGRTRVAFAIAQIIALAAVLALVVSGSAVAG